LLPQPVTAVESSSPFLLPHLASPRPHSARGCGSRSPAQRGAHRDGLMRPVDP